MALVNCKECGGQVSKKAEACPHCGAPRKKKPQHKSGCGSVLVLLVLLVILATQIEPEDPTPTNAKDTIDESASAYDSSADTAKSTPSDEQCRESLECWSKRHRVDAEYRCQVAVERMAKYDHKWNDSWLQSKIPYARWANKSDRTLTYLGDAIQFQNGFGAWEHYWYECDYDPNSDTILDVHAQAGRLPK